MFNIPINDKGELGLYPIYSTLTINVFVKEDIGKKDYSIRFDYDEYDEGPNISICNPNNGRTLSLPLKDIIKMCTDSDDVFYDIEHIKDEIDKLIEKPKDKGSSTSSINNKLRSVNKSLENIVSRLKRINFGCNKI